MGLTLDKTNDINFVIFVLLLPFCALGYFYNIFSAWASNASLYPLLLGLVLIFINSLIKNKLTLTKELNYLIIFSFIVLIGTFIMSLIIANLISIQYGNYEDVYISAIKKIFTFSIVFLTVYYTALSTTRLGYKLVINILYFSLMLILIYGYIQVFAILFPFSLWYKIYISIQHYINFGWVGLNEGFNKIPQIYIYGGRVILTTQEPSVAGYLVTTLYYPFILSSLINGYSIYKSKLLGFPIEFILFIFTLPIVFFTFSTSLYVIFIILSFSSAYLYLNNLSLRKLIKFLFYFMLFIIIVMLIYINLPKDYISNISQALEKIFLSGKGKGSAQTRYGFMYAGIVEFLHYPIFGVGVGNSKYFFPKYIPIWAYNSEVISYLSTGQALGPKGFWSWLLGETGILGSLTFFLFLYSLITRYFSKAYKNSKDKIYLKHAFLLFLISFFLQGFNSAALFFIWQWAIFGFFIGFLYYDKSKSSRTKYETIH